MQDLEVSNSINPNSLPDPSLSSLSLPKGPIKISVSEKQLDALFGNKKDNMQETIKGVERQLLRVGKDSHLLNSSEYKNWKSYIETSAIELNQAILDRDSTSFSSKLSELSNSLKGLESFFTIEKDQGLIAVHAVSGVRVYRQETSEGEKVTLCTPDKKAFANVDNAELQKYVKNITKNVEINANDATYAQSEGSNGLACRLDSLKLGSGNTYAVSTVTRSEVGINDNNIEFTREQLNSGGTFSDTTRGFGHGDAWPIFAVEIIPAGYNPDDFNPSKSGSNGSGSDSGSSQVKRLAGGLVQRYTSIPVMPDVTMKNFGRNIMNKVGDTIMRRASTPRPTSAPEAQPTERTQLRRPKRVAKAKGPSLSARKVKMAKFLKNHPRIANAVIRTRKQFPTFRKGLGAVRHPIASLKNIPGHLKNVPTHARNIPTRLKNIPSQLKSIPNKLVGNNPAVKGTVYMSALVGLHKFCSGEYKPESEHTYLPSLLDGGLNDDKLRAWGVPTHFKTKDSGIMLAWGVDTASTVGDLGIIYGTAKGTQLTAAGGLRLVGLSRAAGFTGGALKLGGRALGVAYAPVAGYSYFSDGAFINESDSEVNLRVTGTVLEGAAAGFMVGGPWGAVGGVALSTGGAMYGSYTALEDVIAQGHKKGIQAGIKMTFRRAERGMLMPSHMPDNTLNKEAEEHIDKIAKAAFMKRALTLGIDKESFGLKPGDWKENWENIDSLLKEVKEYKDGYRGKYIPLTGYHFDVPLQGLSNDQRDMLVKMYDHSFNDEDGAKQVMTKQYKRAYIIETRDTSTQTAWQAIWDPHSADGAKIEVKDSLSEFAGNYENSELNLVNREKSLRDEGASFDDPRVQQLIQDQRQVLEKEMPGFFGQIQDEETKNRISYYTSERNQYGITKESPVINTYAVEAFFGEQKELLAEVEYSKSAEHQEFILGGLEGDDKIAMQKHLKGEELLDTDRFAELSEKAYQVLSSQTSGMIDARQAAAELQAAAEQDDIQVSELMFDDKTQSSILESLNSEEKAVVQEFWQSGGEANFDRAVDLIEKGLASTI